MGTAAGAAAGLVIYALAPLGYPLRFTGSWPAGLYDAALALAVVIGLGVTVTAGRAAARRASRQDEPGRLADAARQRGKAGLCAGAAAALVISVLSTGTIALLPREAGLLQRAMAHLGQWASGLFGPGTPHGFEVNNSVYAAGYFLVLVLFPLLGCSIGFWGGPRSGRASRSTQAGTRPRLPAGTGAAESQRRPPGRLRCPRWSQRDIRRSR